MSPLKQNHMFVIDQLHTPIPGTFYSGFGLSLLKILRRFSKRELICVAQIFQHSFIYLLASICAQFV